MDSKSSDGGFLSIGLLVALGAALSSCTSPKMNVELRQIHPVLVSSRQIGKRTLIHLEGWVMVSQGGIEKISGEYSKGELALRIELGMEEGLSPEIDFQTLLPEGIDRVVLGSECIPIWDRAHGSLVKPSRVKPSHTPPFDLGAGFQIQSFDWDAWNRRVDQAQ